MTNADGYLIGHILRDHAILLLDALHVIRILPAKLRCQRHYQSGKPHAEYHNEDTPGRSQIVVINVRNGPISAQPQDGKVNHKLAVNESEKRAKTVIKRVMSSEYQSTLSE